MLPEPVLSVVVPVHDGAATLAGCLNAILGSDLERDCFEIIVVDDASNDRSAIIAARSADTVIRLAGRHSGSAYARNRGAEIARGRTIAFVDQDIKVKPDTLRRMLQVLAENPGLQGVSAAHDNEPVADNFISQYWNLLLHYGETSHGGVGGNFGSGCGMVRRATLFSAGLYDEWRFGSGGLEGIELGQRLEHGGHDVFLLPDLQVTQLKRWTVRSVLREVWNRSALLARSLGYQRTRLSAPGDVVFTLSRASIPCLAVLGTAGLTAAFLPEPSIGSKAFLGFAVVVLANFPVLEFYARERGILFALAVTPIHFLVQFVGATALCAGWLMRDAVGDRMPDAATQAYAEVGVEMWPPIPRRR
ncbi:MAG TPA: glycosyltransferase family 2 protein [Gemmatimonadaceae bacterium]|jgi:glycosyltransferase involved in cell wall biosynthesis|nr:glycosyltransferase family 2 protein [Gemmatimonadaceae bacterium]